MTCTHERRLIQSPYASTLCFGKLRLYLDLDFECLRPLDLLLAGAELVLRLEPQSHAERPAVKQRGLDKIVCNALIASMPNHPFWERISTYMNKYCSHPGVLDATSIFLMRRSYEAIRQNIE